MAKELVKVKEDLSVLKCLNEMRAQAGNVTRVHSIYVVDEKNRLKGRLSLKDLITANSRAKVKDIYIPKVDFVTVDQDGDEVAKIMSKYDLEAIPVINSKKELLGRITIDDIIDLIKEEYIGIRPAPGYPSCPDHSEKDKIWKLLDVKNNVGIGLTESRAMDPASSVCGWYFSHPESQYFSVMKNYVI